MWRRVAHAIPPHGDRFFSLHQVHDESKDKLYEFEVSWICKQSNYQHEFVPADLLAEANRLAEEELNPPDEME